MSGSLTDYAEQQMLSFMFSALPVTRPSIRTLAMHVNLPGEGGSNNSDQTIPRVSVGFFAPTGGRSWNNSDITVSTANLALRTIRGYSIWDANSGGHCLGWGNFTQGFNMGSGFINEKVPVTRGTHAIQSGEVNISARGLSLYGRHLGLDWLFRSVAVVRPTAWYMGVHYSPPEDNGIGGELLGGGATRQPLVLGAPAAGASFNVSQIIFGPSIGGWPRLTHYSIWDAPINGNCLMTRVLAAPYDVGNSQKLVFAPGNFQVSVG